LIELYKVVEWIKLQDSRISICIISLNDYWSRPEPELEVKGIWGIKPSF